MMIDAYQHHKPIQVISDYTVFICFYLFYSHWMSLVTNHIKPYKWYEEGVWSDQFPYYLLIRKWSFSAWSGSTPGWRLLVDICMPHAPPFPRVGAWTFVSTVFSLLVYDKSSFFISPHAMPFYRSTPGWILLGWHMLIIFCEHGAHRQDVQTQGQPEGSELQKEAGINYVQWVSFEVDWSGVN